MKRFDSPGQIKVGTIGYGASFQIAKHHLSQMKSIGMVPTAVADIDESRLPVAQEDFPGIQTFSSATELLANCDVDVLAICTPHNTHADLAIECMDAGRHVVTEKPFAITTDECNAMIKAVKRNDVMLSTYHNRHWDGWILSAVEKIRGGMIGDVVRIEAHSCGFRKPRQWWRSCKSISGGIMYDWGAHYLEYALQLLDGNMTEVYGHARYGFWNSETGYGDDSNEDEALAVVRFDNNQMLTLFMSNIDSTPRRGMLEVVGTRGTFFVDPKGWGATVQEGDAEVHRSGPNHAAETWRFYQNIADHLVDEAPLIITPEYARRPIHVMDLAGQSAKAGHALPTAYA
ncbi:MAG: Gfo/Idh/MocA family oxidoreductase [Lentisphaeria bacterium]|nr:Gfo/Idh/MocA family oxidoreductase [Lentisphaeria bacterium]